LICNYEELINNFSHKLRSISAWESKVKTNGFWLYRLNVSDTFDGTRILNRVSSIYEYIEKTLHVSVYLKRVNIPANDLSWILPSNLKLNRWSQLENLLVAYKNCESEISKEKQFNAYIDKAIECLHKCAKIAEEEVLDSKNSLDILTDQLKLLSLKQKRYGPCTVIFAFMISNYSSSLYDYIRQYLTLPHNSIL
jgi:hypothetical protein